MISKLTRSPSETDMLLFILLWLACMICMTVFGLGKNGEFDIFRPGKYFTPTLPTLLNSVCFYLSGVVSGFVFARCIIHAKEPHEETDKKLSGDFIAGAMPV